MARLWDILDDKSKAALTEIARQQGMLSFSPGKPSQQPVVKVEGKLEDLTEIAQIVRLTDSQIKERDEIL
jgi:hypothetical protein